MCKIMLVFALSMLPFCAALADEELPGTYKLISSTRTILATGEVEDSYGKQPKGYVMYGKDGRMLVLITHEGRPMPSRTDMTDKDRADQYRTLNAYGEHIRSTVTGSSTTLISPRMKLEWAAPRFGKSSEMAID